MPLPPRNAERKIAEVLLAQWIRSASATSPARTRNWPRALVYSLSHAVHRRCRSLAFHQVESVEMQHPAATQDLTPLLTALRAIDLDA